MSEARYQTDINVWQLGANGEKVYGYKLQNVFPSAVGQVTYEDGEENTLSEFTITFTFSEFTPLENKSVFSEVGEALAGDAFVDIDELKIDANLLPFMLQASPQGMGYAKFPVQPVQVC